MLYKLLEATGKYSKGYSMRITISKLKTISRRSV